MSQGSNHLLTRRLELLEHDAHVCVPAGSGTTVQCNNSTGWSEGAAWCLSSLLQGQMVLIPPAENRSLWALRLPWELWALTWRHPERGLTHLLLSETFSSLKLHSQFDLESGSLSGSQTHIFQWFLNFQRVYQNIPQNRDSLDLSISHLPNGLQSRPDRGLSSRAMNYSCHIMSCKKKDHLGQGEHFYL